MRLRGYPGENVEKLCDDVTDICRQIEGAGAPPADFSSLVARVFLRGEVLEFMLHATSIHDSVNKNPQSLSWQDILSAHRTKFFELVAEDL